MANQHSEIQIGDGSLHIGDRVVYPNQGICRITGVEVKQIAGRDWEVVTLSREEDGATVMVPREKVMGIGLRKVANVDAIDEVFDQLAAPGEEAQLDWKVRHRENADRMSGGGLFGTVEVLKSLHLLSRIRPLPQKERELYDNARHLLVGEIAAAMNIPIHVAEDNLDYALWPPEGMKRKGRALVPAALGPPAGPVKLARADDADDLDFEDDDEGGDGEAAAAKPAVAAVDDADDEGDDVDEGAEKPAAKAGDKAAKKPLPKAAGKGKSEPKPEAKADARSTSKNLLAELAAVVRGPGKAVAAVAAQAKVEPKKAPAAAKAVAAATSANAQPRPAAKRSGPAAKGSGASAKGPAVAARSTAPSAKAKASAPAAKAKPPAPAAKAKAAPAPAKKAAAAPAKKVAPAAAAKAKAKGKR